MAEPAPQPMLQARHLNKVYPDGKVAALVDVSLDIPAGQYVAIMGPSGSGKSTLLNLLGALDTPTSGDILFEGQPLDRFGSFDRLRAERIGFVFQSFHLLPVLTVLENVQIPMFETKRSSAARVERARELLAAVNMSHRENHLPNQLSVGERQRVAIARSLANDPALLLADEPTGNLDSRTGEEILDLFDRLHAQQRKTLVVITHSQEVAERAERIIRIRDGHVASDLLNPARPAVAERVPTGTP